MTSNAERLSGAIVFFSGLHDDDESLYVVSTSSVCQTARTAVPIAHDPDQGPYSFITYAQNPEFQTHPRTLYAVIMTSLWQQYTGVRMALDPPSPSVRR